VDRLAQNTTEKTGLSVNPSIASTREEKNYDIGL
jgi:hypothetical protein